jgi:hypothetical protein
MSAVEMFRGPDHIAIRWTFAGIGEVFSPLYRTA